MSFQDSGTCRATVGLLFLRDCGKRVAGRCQSCGRPVCKKHRITGAEGFLCPECAAQEERFQDRDSVRKIHDRNRYHDEHDYRPYYYSSYGTLHHHDHFSDHDYDTFDDQGAEGGAQEDAGAGENQDWGANDEYMDS